MVVPLGGHAACRHGKITGCSYGVRGGHTAYLHVVRRKLMARNLEERGQHGCFYGCCSVEAPPSIVQIEAIPSEMIVFMA